MTDNVLDRTAPAVAADLLAADTSMGAVTLLVADLDVMTAYYRDAVTLTLLAQGEGRSILGRGTTPIVILEHAPGAETRRTTGRGSIPHGDPVSYPDGPGGGCLRRRVSASRVVHR